MHLRLLHQVDNASIQSGVKFAENRLYVARSLIPEEFESYFQETANYISAHTSTAIEGNPLGEEESMRVLAEGPDPSQPLQVEKANLDEAYELMGQLASDKLTKIDEGIIRSFNSIVLKGLPKSQSRNRGKYRFGPSLVLDQITREIRYRPPPAAWVAELMKNYVSDVSAWIDELPCPVAAALAHFGLVSIHPFEDGNGRTARLVADMLLCLTGCSADGMISISQAIHNNLGDYYRVLRETQGENFQEEIDVTDFILFHNDALGAAAASLEEKAVWYRKLRDQYAQEMEGILNDRQVSGMLFMIGIGGISTSRFARLTESSQTTALADLNSLVKQGLAVKTGAGKNTRYRLSPTIIEAMDREEE